MRCSKKLASRIEFEWFAMKESLTNLCWYMPPTQDALALGDYEAVFPWRCCKLQPSAAISAQPELSATAWACPYATDCTDSSQPAFQDVFGVVAKLAPFEISASGYCGPRFGHIRSCFCIVCPSELLRNSRRGHGLGRFPILLQHPIVLQVARAAWQMLGTASMVATMI